MTEQAIAEAQDLPVEITEDVKIEEVPKTEAKETEDNSSPDAEVEEAEQETVEQKVERLERETAGKQKAIDRKTAAYHALQRKLDSERQERESLAKLIEDQAPKNEPVIDDFETHDEYVDALANYRAEKQVANKQKDFLAQQEQMQQQMIMQERLGVRQSQEAEYLQENPLYKSSVVEVDGYIKTLSSSPEAQEAVIGQLYRGNVPQVIDYFGSNNGENLEELGRIAALSAPEAAVEIYKIQQKLSMIPDVKETKPKTKPVKAEKGNAKGVKSLSKKSGSEILDWVKS